MVIAFISLSDILHHIFESIGIVISDIAIYTIACPVFDWKGSFGW
jgi:hypothetical protein